MNKKGFTLLEMLAAIAILMILSVVVLLSANKLLKTSRNKYYQTQEELMILAAKDYFSDYIVYLPKEENETKQVLLEALIKEKYINQVVDSNDDDCDSKKSYIEVKKISSKEYLYSAHLVCGNYQTKAK